MELTEGGPGGFGGPGALDVERAGLALAAAASSQPDWVSVRLAGRLVGPRMMEMRTFVTDADGTERSVPTPVNARTAMQDWIAGMHTRGGSPPTTFEFVVQADGTLDFQAGRRDAP